MSKVDEVARSMHDAVNVTGEPWVYVKGDEYCEAQMTCARAAIEAQAKPSTAMIDAGVAFALNNSIHGEGGWSKYVAALYEYMTRASLREG